MAEFGQRKRGGQTAAPETAPTGWSPPTQTQRFGITFYGIIIYRKLNLTQIKLSGVLISPQQFQGQTRQRSDVTWVQLLAPPPQRTCYCKTGN